MGSGESTRRVTVERDRDTGSVGIIKVSENDVRQLRGEKELPLETDEPLTKDDINRLWQELQHEKSHLDHQKQHLQEILQRAFDEGRQVEAKRLQKESKATEKMSTKDRADLENQITQMGKETEKIDHENLAELHYLREKVAQQEKITSEHFQEAVEEVRKKFSQSMRTPVCQNLHNEVLKCYKQYPTESLRCSQQVREFVHCVEQSRLAFLQESK